jgi:hypothetical protein
MRDGNRTEVRQKRTGRLLREARCQLGIKFKHGGIKAMTVKDKAAGIRFIGRSLKLAKDRIMEAITEIGELQNSGVTDEERRVLDQADTRMVSIHCEIGEVEESFQEGENDNGELPKMQAQVDGNKIG